MQSTPIRSIAEWKEWQAGQRNDSFRRGGGRSITATAVPARSKIKNGSKRVKVLDMVDLPPVDLTGKDKDGKTLLFKVRFENYKEYEVDKNGGVEILTDTDEKYIAYGIQQWIDGTKVSWKRRTVELEKLFKQAGAKYEIRACKACGSGMSTQKIYYWSFIEVGDANGKVTD